MANNSNNINSINGVNSINNSNIRLVPKNANQFFIPGPAGNLDTLKVSQEGQLKGIAIIFHPDPMGGGTYTNKVVQTLAKALSLRGYIAFCPNLRGVGLSEGNHVYGNQNIEDGLAIYNYIVSIYPNMPIILAGFSFGTFVAANVSEQCSYQKLILVGPAVTRFPFRVTQKDKILVIHGSEDEIIPLARVYTWAKNHNFMPICVFPEATHFFHGKLLQLQNFLVNQVLF